MASFHHRKLPDSSTLLAGPVPPDEVGFPSDRLQIWYNHAEEAWVDPLPHAHQDSDECFIILQGRVVVEVEGERFTIGPREFCCFPRGVYHQVVEVPPQQKRSCFELRQSATKCISRNQTNRLLACKSDGFFGLTCTVSLRNPWEVLAALADLEVDQGGNVVGWGLTFIPTPHRFRVNGQQFYTWCALDALTYPALLQVVASVESFCPVSAAPVTLSVTPAGVHDLTPAGAIVSVAIPEPGSSCNGDRSSFCTQSLFFRSRREALLWQASSPSVRLLSVADAYQVGRLIARYRYPS